MNTPNPKTSSLQTAFNELLSKNKEIPKSGFFGGSSNTQAPSGEKLISDTVNLILREAMKLRASDIHLEPQDVYLRVRFRIDGIMEEVLQIPHTLNLRVVSNFRVTCGLDPEKTSGGKPEDGRSSVKLEGKDVDLRLSTFPTPLGDKAVLRVIIRDAKASTLDDLKLAPHNLSQLRTMIHHPQGMIIVTGPTGSGKSTTLYACLHALNDSTRNIVTLEDPIERRIPGITQGMIQNRQGFGFAEGLRAILRQDPNVIMVGEIRDQETAEIALSASLTGHLLMTTLHTASAIGAINRLIDMGLEPYLVASALTAVTAQRLARTICSNCVTNYSPTAEQMADIGIRAKKAGVTLTSDFGTKLKRGAGCEQCRGSGYLGRVLIFEAAVMTPALREATSRKSSNDELRSVAARNGMETLLHDGIRKVSEGRTTLQEILRVVDSYD